MHVRSDDATVAGKALSVITEPRERESRIPTREECIRAADEMYGSILADPVLAAQIRAGRAAVAARRAAEHEREEDSTQ